jgi:hypothetical protein
MRKLYRFGLLALLGGLVLSGCGKKATAEDYDVRGWIVKVEPGQKTVTIQHEDIPGYLGAGESQFEVQDEKLLAGLQPHDGIEGRVRVLGGSAILTRLDKISSGEDARVQAGRAKLSHEDQKLVAAQGFCPIQKQNRLGVMGKPFKLAIKGQTVFLCCSGCERDALADPDRTLAQVEERKRETKAAAARSEPVRKRSAREAKIEANLALLGDEDRRLAKAQGFCPIQSGNPLGIMGKPFKVTVKGQPVFLCCPGCEEEALADPDVTLNKVGELKRQARARN